MADRLQDRLRATRGLGFDIPTWVGDLLTEAADRIDELEAGPASSLAGTYRQALVDIAGWENWQRPTWREIAQAALETRPRAYQPPMARCDNPDGRCTMREWCTSYDACWAATDRDTDELPLIPMRWHYEHARDVDRAFTDAMTNWVRAVLRATNPEQTFSTCVDCERGSGNCLDESHCRERHACLWPGPTGTGDCRNPTDCHVHIDGSCICQTTETKR